MAQPIPILLYHSIANEASSRFRKWTITPERFAAQMAYLAEQQYTSLTITQLSQIMRKKRGSLPDRPVLITFDDGFADFYKSALPILARWGLTATLYITTGYIGGTSRWLAREGEGYRAVLSWADITEINRSGIECGAHTHTHPQLDILPLAVAREEIYRSKIILEQHLDQPVLTFAYPHGYYSPAVRRLVQEAGYASACGVKHALSSVDDDGFALARIIVTADTDLATFHQLLTGQNLRVAPIREQLQIKGWRFIRRSMSFLKPPAYEL